MSTKLQVLYSSVNYCTVSQLLCFSLYNIVKSVQDPLMYYTFTVFILGHSRELVDGHTQFMEGVKPITGYHGAYGFRRNTPWLRQWPSPFGAYTRSALH